MVLTYFTINSILILFLDENKRCLEIFHTNHKITKTPDELRAKNFKSVLPHTKPSTIFAKDRNETRCGEQGKERDGVEK